MTRNVHIIGGGLAGMSVAAGLKAHGFKGEITIYEANSHPGGRIASFFLFNQLVDDNHLLVKANKNVLSLLNIIGSSDELVTVKPCLKFKEKSLSKLVDLAITSILNTSPNECAKGLLFKTLAKVATAPFPVMVRDNFNTAIIKPFIKYANKQNINIVCNVKCEGVKSDELCFTKNTINIAKDDKVIFALPYDAMQKIYTELPQITFSPITNIHFLLKEAPKASQDFCGVVGGTGHWYKLWDDLLSVTISNCDNSDDNLIRKIWDEAKKICEITGEYSDVKTVLRKRATITQSSKNLEIRNNALKFLDNQGIFYAGDWTVCGLPATMEAAVYSGFKVANRLI